MSYQDVVAALDATIVTHIEAAGEAWPKRTWCGVQFRSEGDGRRTASGAPVMAFEGDEDCDAYCPACLERERRWSSANDAPGFDEVGP